MGRSLDATSRPARCGLILVLALLAFLTGCLHGRHAIRPPDRERFFAAVPSPALRGDFEGDRLAPGMPYFVVDELFAEWGDVYHRPVASIGSRQELRDKEGWGRLSHDPHIKVFMREFKTKQGEIAVWYRFADFYRIEVSAGDTLAVYVNDTVLVSPICCLLGPTSLAVEDSLAGLPEDSLFFAEIRHLDHPRYTVTYWYLMGADDPVTFYLEPAGFDLYPIEAIEVDNEPVESFLWRSQDENR
jgi:hypothetical protein